MKYRLLSAYIGTAVLVVWVVGLLVLFVLMRTGVVPDPLVL